MPVTPLSSVNKTEFPVDLPFAEIGESTASVSKISPKEGSPDYVGNSPASKTFIPTGGSNSAPATPIPFRKSFDDSFERESPVSMDEGGESDRATLSSSYDQLFRGELTPPQTPVRGPADYVTPTAGTTTTFDPQTIS